MWPPSLFSGAVFRETVQEENGAVARWSSQEGIKLGEEASRYRATRLQFSPPPHPTTDINFPLHQHGGTSPQWQKCSYESTHTGGGERSKSISISSCWISRPHLCCVDIHIQTAGTELSIRGSKLQSNGTSPRSLSWKTSNNIDTTQLSGQLRFLELMNFGSFHCAYQPIPKL